jgi:hypothetical protein
MLPVIVVVLPQDVPVQPENVDPVAGVTIKTTTVPVTKVSLQSLPQLIPVALTVPLPLPALLMVSV